jgi:predicted GNAT family acetyltransferase
MSDTHTDSEVRDNTAEHRFEIPIGDDLAIAEYRLKPGTIDFVHTFVPESARGKGIAGKLIKAALASARERKLGVEVECTAFAAYIKGHPETHDLLTDETRTALAV